MAERIVELRWTCGECGRKDILGREKRCPSCGSPREQGEMQMDGLHDLDAEGRNVGATVTDPALLDLANAGADWFCAHCGTGNRNGVTNCVGCGAARAEAAVGETDGALLEGPEGSAPNPDGASWSFEGDPPPPLLNADPQRLAKRIALGVGAVALVIGAIVFWATRTHEDVGTVASTAWTQHTVLQTWQPVRREGWRHELRDRAEVPPRHGGGEVAGVRLLASSCKDKHYEDERYACGTDRVCSPRYRTESYSCGETCTSNGNGFATCSPRTCTRSVADGETCHDQTRYCTRPIYRPWCAYDTQDWVETGRSTARGEGVATTWPEVATGPLDRLRYAARYEVTVAYEDGGDAAEHAFDPTVQDDAPSDAPVDEAAAKAREAAFRAWAPGEAVTLTVGRGGKVKTVALGTPAD